MIFCNILNKSFNSKSEMFKELKRNESKIIKLKKSKVFKSCEKEQFSPLMNILKGNESIKAAFDGMDKEYIYPVINTTLLMDSHDDVHFNGIWDDSLKEVKDSLFYITDHEISINNMISWKTEAFVKMIAWSALGKSFEGETQALIFKVKKSDIINSAALKAIEENMPVQNSVRMYYDDITLAVNSDEPDYADNKKFFDENINKIANKVEVLEQGYFWGVTKASIVREGSMVPLGSNPVTPILQLNEDETEIKNEIKEDQIKNVLLNFL